MPYFSSEPKLGMNARSFSSRYDGNIRGEYLRAQRH